MPFEDDRKNAECKQIDTHRIEHRAKTQRRFQTEQNGTEPKQRNNAIESGMMGSIEHQSEAH